MQKIELYGGKIIKSSLFASLILIMAISAGPTFAATDISGTDGWCTITVKDLVVDSNIFFASILPGEAITITITPKVPIANSHWSVQTGHLSGVGLERVYMPPYKPGRYPVTITSHYKGRKLEATIQIFSLVPFNRIKNGRLEGFEIGTYPDPREKRNSPYYQYPRGFIRVVKDDVNVHITENYRLGEFLPHAYRRWPKFVLVDEKLALKLEIVTNEFRARGLMKKRFKFLSAFRPPARNKKSGQSEFSRHQYGCAVDMFVDDSGKGDWMDDLSFDGRVNLLDALVMYRIIDEMEGKGDLKGLEGGLGAYPPRRSHGPFVHMDVRGGPARWIHDHNGRKVKNIAGFLKMKKNLVHIPPRGQQYVRRKFSTTTASHSRNNIESLKNYIRKLDKEVLRMEQRWQNIEAGPKPLGSDDLYLAADVANDNMLLNRGRVILKRVSIEDGDPPPRCPDGLADIYSVPEGILEVRGKSVEPVWFHPDWSFIGAGLPSPIKKLRKAFYSGGGSKNTLDLGAGIRIHPANLPGGVVLPGCISVPTTDMKSLDEHTKVGTRVYLYEGGAYIAGGNLSKKKKKDLIALQAFLTLRMRAADLDKNYLLFDLKRNHGWIKRGEVIVRTLRMRVVGPCFGKDHADERRRFRMPRGTLLVQRRMDQPPWYKPDWMYRKQGKTVPGPMGSDRIQRGLIGSNALYLGGGIVIHGKHDRLVPGNAIDYVAIELDQQDLQWVWRTIPAGGVVILK